MQTTKFKRALSLALTLVMALTLIHLSSIPASAAEAGSFQATLDGDTSTLTPDIFGESAGDGLVWTDKSVAVNGSGFDVTLSALAQEYLSTATVTGAGERLAADVTFILDMSTSMSSAGAYKDINDGAGGTYYRIQAMVMAVNEAIKIIMDANPDNRIAIHWFGGPVASPHVGTMLPMAKYTLSNGTDYLTWNGSPAGRITTSASLVKDDNDNSYASKQFDTAGGTPTQNGVMYSISNMIAEIKTHNTGDIGKRQPFVLLLSDGAASIGNSNWWTSPGIDAAAYTNYGALSGSNTTGSKEVAAATILTAAYMKDQLTAAYAAYPGNAGEDLPTNFYSIGLGGDSAINNPATGTDTQVNYAWCGLDPASLALGGSKAGSVAAGAVRDQIATYVADAGAGYEKYGDPESYVYSGYYQFASTYALLSNAFDKLAEDVASATQNVNLPVDNSSSAIENNNAITFVDEIGAGMEINGAPVLSGKTGVLQSDGKTYKFADYKSTADVVVVSGITTLTWHIAAEDMAHHMYVFANRNTPVSGTYATPAPSPITLKYNLKLKNAVPAGDTPVTYYANAFVPGAPPEAKANAIFTPMLDNPYYYFSNGNVGRVGELADLWFGSIDNDISHYVTGMIVGSTPFGIYSDVYVTSDMVEHSGGALTQSQIGTILGSIDATTYAGNSDFLDALADTLYDCAVAATDDSSANYAFLSGIPKPTYANNAIVTVNKSGGLSGVPDYVSKTTLEGDGKVTTLLGNNGVLSLNMGISKTAPQAAVAGSTISYSITVYNYDDAAKSNVVVTDIVPTGLTNITDTTVLGVATYNDSSSPTITWTIDTLAANSSVTLTFTADVPGGASPGDTYENKATITSVNSIAVGVTSNETTSTVGDSYEVTVDINLDGLDWDGSPGQPTPPTITLVDGSGTVYNDLSNIPDGATYKIYADGEDTGKTVTVAGGNASETLNYYTLTLVAGTGVGSVTGGGVYLEGAQVTIDAGVSGGYNWNKWSSSPGGSDETTKNATITMPGNSLTLTATASDSGGTGYWPPSPTPKPPVTTPPAVIVNPSEGGGYRTETSGDTTTYIFTPDEGYYVRDVLVNGESIGARDFYTVDGLSEDLIIEPIFAPLAGLNRDDHFAYIIGRPDGFVYPQKNVTREEAATIFFRLLEVYSRDYYLTEENPFVDVSPDRWSNCAISTLYKIGIVKGKTATEFDPAANITRAEMAAIASRFDTLVYGGGVQFTDISGHWAQDEIRSAATRGWVEGVGDGTFRPDALITRAEAMTLINRVLGRVPETPDDLLDNMVVWPDNADPNAWYYLAVQEATNSHDFEHKADHYYERWTALQEIFDWTIYEH